MRSEKRANLRLPKGWPSRVRLAILHVISLAQYAAVSTRRWAADSSNARVWLRAEYDRVRQELALLQEKMRIKDARMAGIPPHRRPFYRPTDRLAILELRAARGWSVQQTANALLVTAATVASWMKRLDDDGPDGLLQVRSPINRFLDFARYSVQRMQALCPTVGKKKLAEILARAGMHLGTTTIGRMFRSSPTSVDLRVFLGRIIPAAGTAPRHLISDRGRQFFRSTGYKRWCKRIELRPHWPRGSTGPRPQVLVAGKPGTRFKLEIERTDGQVRLPIVRLRRAA